jgi:hypothetical protein
MIKILKITPNDDHTLSVELSNGKKGIFDINPYLEIGVFKQLKNINFFKQVYTIMNGVGIEWKTGQDLSADTIEYELQER